MLPTGLTYSSLAKRSCRSWPTAHAVWVAGYFGAVPGAWRDATPTAAPGRRPEERAGQFRVPFQIPSTSSHSPHAFLPRREIRPSHVRNASLHSTVEQNAVLGRTKPPKGRATAPDLSKHHAGYSDYWGNPWG